MKKAVLIELLLLLCAAAAKAQEMPVTDTTAIAIPPALDSTLLGKDIYQYIVEANVEVNRSPEVDSALVKYISHNPARQLHGYRISLFFDNKQSARNESENVESLFKESFPTIPVYRSYANPYFKVVAGDYRTKSDALRELPAVKKLFPNAFIIKEYINFPRL